MLDEAKQRIKAGLLTPAVKYLAKDPVHNIDNLLKIGLRLAIKEDHKTMFASFRQTLSDSRSNWHKLYTEGIQEIDPHVREKLMINFAINSFLIGVPRENRNAARLGFSVPWAILFDPTDRCNLRCRGCWAGEYQKKNDLSFEEIDRLITEGEALGIYFYVVSGGEPLIRKKDLLALAHKHNDSVFHIFTNATLIDEAFCQEAVKCGNLTFAISVDGFEESTDLRRGKGTFDKVMKAVDLLRSHGLVYGFSSTYTRLNVEEIGSDSYIDMLIDKGFKYGWFFTYVPVGADCDLEYMATPEQRKFMHNKVNEWRTTKPVFIADFWNDGQYVHGCIAGGNRYFHINAAGEAEPCAFVHYSTINFKDHSLIEVLGNPLFKAYQQMQPFNRNMLRPCPIIDNPLALAQMVEQSNAYSTQASPVNVRTTADNLVAYSKAWGETSDHLWREKEHESARVS